MRQYIKLLLISRISIYLLSLISSTLIPHGEQSANHYQEIFKGNSELTFNLLRPMIFYDGDYFLEISLFGFQYDKTQAFFPGFPILIKILVDFMVLLSGSSQRLILTLTTGYFVNLMFSILTIIFLSKTFDDLDMKLSIMKDITIKIFIFNSMSIYFCSFYSEPLFLLIQIIGIRQIAFSLNNKLFDFLTSLKCALIFAVGGFVRSNGFLSVGFVLYFYFIYNFSSQNYFKVIFGCFLLIFISFFPFFWIQFLEYKLTCLNELDLSLCQNKFPIIYGYLQKKYWDVEFLSFIEGRRLVNIVYCTPILAFIYFAFKNWIFKYDLGSKMTNVMRLKKVENFEDFLIPHVYLLLVLLFVGMTTMHFNSFNRLLAGYPFYYLFLAMTYINLKEKGRTLMRFWLLPFQVVVIVFAVNNYVPI